MFFLLQPEIYFILTKHMIKLSSGSSVSQNIVSQFQYSVLMSISAELLVCCIPQYLSLIHI